MILITSLAFFQQDKPTKREENPSLTFLQKGPAMRWVSLLQERAEEEGQCNCAPSDAPQLHDFESSCDPGTQTQPWQPFADSSPPASYQTQDRSFGDASADKSGKAVPCWKGSTGMVDIPEGKTNTGGQRGRSLGHSSSTVTSPQKSLCICLTPTLEQSAPFGLINFK